MKCKLMLLVGATAMALSLTACGDDEEEGGNNNNNTSGPDFSTGQLILNFLDGKTLTMEGDDVPDGLKIVATDCIDSTVITVSSGTFTVTSQVGTVAGTMCDFTSTSEQPAFTSTAASITNVEDNGGCFDFDVVYPALAQEGRGSISQDGTELRLELYAQGFFTGIRCADGDVGADTVMLGGALTPTDVVQSYVID